MSGGYDTTQHLAITVARHDEQIKNNTSDLLDIKQEIKGLRTALNRFALSLLGAAILFAVTVFASGFGK